MCQLYSTYVCIHVTRTLYPPLQCLAWPCIVLFGLTHSLTGYIPKYYTGRRSEWEVAWSWSWSSTYVQTVYYLFIYYFMEKKKYCKVIPRLSLHSTCVEYWLSRSTGGATSYGHEINGYAVYAVMYIYMLFEFVVKKYRNAWCLFL